MLPEVCVGFVVLGIVAYTVLGGADFGAGFWDLTAGGDRRGGRVRGMVQRSMAPVWEANHVWLIFLLVIVWTAFPVAFGSIFSTLSVPLFLAALGIILRGAAFALRGEAATMREARVLGAVFALGSVLIPFFLGAALGGIASGRVEVGNAEGDPVSSWLNPTGVLVGVIGVLTGAYLAAVFLAGDARRAGLPDLVRAFRLRALGAGAATGAVALGGLLVVREDAPALYAGLTSGGGLAAVVGWALAQDPYLLPPALTLDEAAASDATLTALVVSVLAGMVLLVPSLWYLYRLVLQGRLDQEYEPLDQRFRPLRAGDEPPPR